MGCSFAVVQIGRQRLALVQSYKRVDLCRDTAGLYLAHVAFSNHILQPVSGRGQVVTDRRKDDDDDDDKIF